MPKPEQQIQNAIMEFLAVNHIWYMRVNTGAVVSEHNGKKRMFRFGMAGAADILCSVRQARYSGDSWYTAWLWLEVKAPKGVQSPSQIRFMDEVRAEGHYYAVVRSIEDVEAVLKEIRGY